VIGWMIDGSTNRSIKSLVLVALCRRSSNCDERKVTVRTSTSVLINQLGEQPLTVLFYKLSRTMSEIDRV